MDEFKTAPIGLEKQASEMIKPQENTRRETKSASSKKCRTAEAV
jgi:hypothetical protein